MTQTINNPIAQLNDQLRRTFLGGTVVSTIGVQSLPAALQQAIIQAVQSFYALMKTMTLMASMILALWFAKGFIFTSKLIVCRRSGKEKIHMN